MIAKHVTQDNREDLLQLAEAHTARNLQAIMRGEEPIIGGRVILLHFTGEQFAAFSKAILAHGAIQNGDGFIGKEKALIDALDQTNLGVRSTKVCRQMRPTPSCCRRRTCPGRSRHALPFALGLQRGEFALGQNQAIVGDLDFEGSIPALLAA